MKKTFNILFVCRHNRFRSKFAESYFKKINKNKNIRVKSAGIFPGVYPLDKLEVEVSKKLGYKIKGYPQPVTTKLLGWKDLIVLITNDLKNANELFNYGQYKNNKIILWKIKDNEGNSRKNIEKILRYIMERVKELNDELNNGKWKQ